MAEINGWNLAVLVIAAYLAIVTLIRLMRRRRDEVVVELQKQVETEQQRVAQQNSRSRRT